jgi:uncharacterized protein (TIGR03663 family)
VTSLVTGLRQTHTDPAPLTRTELDPTWWRIGAAWILIAAALLRFYNLDLKPLHHDEGVNGFFLVNLIRSSSAYRYDPANYHGPSLYYFARASVALFGLTTEAIRFVPAFFGMMTIAIILSWCRRLGGIGSLGAAALLALSPGAVYMSRYFIHEALLVCFTFAAVAAFVQYLESRRGLDLVLTGAALGLMFVTKETWIISVGVAVIAIAGTVILTNADAPAAFRSRRDASAARGPKAAIPPVAALIVFAGIGVVFFSSFLTHPEGITDAVKSFLPWARTGSSAHVHPLWTYLRWMAQEEAVILVLGAIGITLALVWKDNAFAVFAALWAIGILMAYSLIPYKTPWLTLNLIAPLAVIGGFGADQLWLRASRAARSTMTAVAAALCVVVVTQAVSLNFSHYDDPAYPYVYVHTQRDLLRLVADVDAVAQTRTPTTDRLHVSVVSPQQFPLSWYLRNYDVGYYDHVVTTSDTVIIGSVHQDDELASMLGQSYDRKDDYALRPGVGLVLYVRRAK